MHPESALLPDWQHLRHPVIGMVHALPLPGAPGYRGDLADVERRALADAETLAAGGVDGLMIENFGDTPFYRGAVPPITIAALTRLARAVRQRCALPLGINVLRNDGCAALAVAVAAEVNFIRVNVLCGARVTDQGIIEGNAHQLLRERATLRAEHVRILADVDVKHSAALARRSLAEETEDLVLRAGADAVVVSGSATGKSVNLTDLPEVSAAAFGRPVFVGSGVTLEALPRLLPFCQGLIVGTGLKRHGDVSQPVDRQRVEALMACVRQFQ